ncbi:MAG TPA: right-handed parallel beta-helix repeat-containing protein [Bryobacteraceae bacterium]|nr:right-handed parallel beta-helix repeat-containing protein [Bryobacteraceae bacterium]
MPRVTLIAILAAALARAANLYVSPEGRDGAPGTLERPLPSVAAARDAIRVMRHNGATAPITVVLRGGVYWLPETLVLTAEDSGVTWEAYAGERPILSGGRRIANWKKGSGPVWTAPADWQFRQLFVNGRRALRARTPNQGFFRIDGDSSQDKPFLLKYRGNDIRKEWAGRGDVEVVALLAWAEIRMPIAQVDEAAHTARLTADPRASNREKDARYWIENAPDALDSAGEWRLDRAAGAVSYWPLPGENLARDEVVAPALGQLVRLEGARNVVFRGLDFRHADWSMAPAGYADAQAAMEAPSALEAVDAEGVVIDHCVFTQSGGYAVWFGRGCRRNRVTSSEIFDMGAGGIKIGETTQRPAQADRNFEHTVADNDLHDLGLVYPSAIGVWVGQSSRNTISHNHIHDLFYTAVSVGWTWGYAQNLCAGNLIEFNHLHHIGKGMLSDMGAIYTLGVQPGTAIRNNLIHDVQSFTYGGWGIYPDEGSSEMLIENNIVYRTKSAGFHQHYGRENVVRNNLFAFGEEYQLMRTRAEPHVSFTFDGNIVYFESGALLGSNWSGGQFRMNHNVYWDARGGPVSFAGQSLSEWQAQSQDADSLVADPMFANPTSYDFTVLPGSPAWKMGWKKIDMSAVGPRAAPGIARR